MKSVTITLKVPFFDTDPMGIVWHGNYAKYFEVARCAVLDSIDYSYSKMHESGFAFPIVDLHVRYAKPMCFDQEVEVTATIVEWETRLGIAYIARDKATGQKLTTGKSIQVAVDLNTKEMLFASPPVLLEKLGGGER